MPERVSKFRLSSSAFERTDDINKVLPKKMIFLSIEGDETDYFAIVLDRDCGNHDRHLLEECIQLCAKKNYGCFISNPCFEFWLLLHLCDVAKEFTTKEQEELLINTVVSNQHTKTSFEVSKRAHHKKTISAVKFKQYYYPNIKLAIQRSEIFATEFPELLEGLGSNLSELFQKFNYDSQNR